MDNLHVVKQETTLTVEKKPRPSPSIPWFNSSKTRTMLKKSLKTSLIAVNCK